MKLYQAFLWTMIGSLVLAAMLGIWALLMPGFGAVQERVLLSSLMLGLLSLPAFGCSIVLHQRRDRPIMWIGVAMSAVALGMMLFLIWSGIPTWRGFGERMLLNSLSAATVAVWAAHFGLMRLAKLNWFWANAVRLATLWVSGVLAGSILISIWMVPEVEWLWRVIGVMVIIAVCGTIVVPILNLITVITARGSRESLPSSLQIELTCPRCGSAERLMTGAARCRSCGLRITIDVEEPRCHCGYLLHKLTGENCPECGRIIHQADRWHFAQVVQDAPGLSETKAGHRSDD